MYAGNTYTQQEVLEYLVKGVFELDILKAALLFSGKYQQILFALARHRREKSFPGRKIEVRSVIEVSNICSQNCNYCAIGSESISKYFLDESELVPLMEYIYSKGRRVILLQSGENNSRIFIDSVSRSVEKIKSKHSDLTIALCLGNLSRENYLQLRKAGAERYILKFESSNPEVYKNSKPKDTLDNRLRCIYYLFEAGFAVGSGNIVGLPGQTLTDIANDLLFLNRYNFSMNSTTAFVPSEGSKFMDKPCGNVECTLNMMALMRIMNPGRLMPTTSSLEKIQKGGQYQGLMAGANTITVHDGTPSELKPFFPIYSTKRVVPQEEYFKNIVKTADMKF
ncbi:MAG: biotin synthase BioB [Ignavibacteriales bacterium]